MSGWRSNVGKEQTVHHQARWLVVAVLFAACGNGSGGGSSEGDNGGDASDMAQGDAAGADADSAGVDVADGSGGVTDAGDTPSDGGPLPDSTEADGATDAPLRSDASGEDAEAGGIPKAWIACEEDEDCGIAWADCCDSCNGGEPVAARVGNMDEVAALYDPDGMACMGVTCETLPCPAVRAMCKSKRCQVRFETNAEGGCSVFDENTCATSPVCKMAVGTPLAEYCTPETVGQPVPAGCVLSTTCFDIATCARHPGGFISLVFPDTCYPGSWTPCGPSFCEALIPTCELGQPPPVSLYCVRGEPVEEGELLSADSPIRVELRPSGCFPQSCTVVYENTCGTVVFAGTQIAVEGDYCLTLNSQVTCGGDCLGGAASECGVFELASGLYTLQAKGLQKSFTLPSIVPEGGLCIEVPANQQQP